MNRAGLENHGGRLTERDRDLLRPLNEPAPVGAKFGITRHLYRLYQGSPQLVDAFPDLDRDGQAYVEWLHIYGRERFSLIDELLPPAPTQYRHFDPRIPEPGRVLPNKLGVNVAGFLQAELGIGEAGRLIVAALDGRRIPVLPVEITTRPNAGHAYYYDTVPPDAAGFPITIACANPDWLGVIVNDVGRSFFTDRYSIGYWWWEVDGPTPFDWRPNFELVNEVWSASEHIAAVLRPGLDVPVVPMKLPVSVPRPPALARAELGLPEGFLFLFMFDYASTVARKNPFAIVEAFQRSFAPHDGAALAIKCTNARHDYESHQRLLDLAAGRPDIRILNEYVSYHEKNAMIAACDCYVSLHRAEGFGLPLAEAMYLGKPTIATAYSGNLEFMTEENSHLVRYDMTGVGPSARQYPANGVWAEPDIEHAAALMREVFDDQTASRELGARAAQDIRRTHSLEAAGAAMELRLLEVTGALGLTGEIWTGSGSPSRVAELVRQGPVPPRKSAFGPFGTPARRLLLSALRPFIAYQRQVDEQLVREIAERERRVEARIAAGRAAELALGRIPQRGRGPGAPASVGSSGLSARPLHPHLEEFNAGPAGHVIGYRGADDATDPASTYLEFENLFRGSEAVIRERQRRYLPLVRAHAPVLDLGCGRGEFLELLREAGIPASGIDIDSAMVEHGRGKGLHVANAEAVEHLETLEDRSLGTLFAAQVIEHLDYQRLLRLLRTAREKLRTDGLLVLETVNPHCPIALKHFWLDPTHQRPLFPEVMLALCQLSGFTTAYIWFPAGAGERDRDWVEQPDYSIVAIPAVPAPGAVRVSTDVGELWYPGECQVLTPTVQQTGTWDPDDGRAMVEALAPGMTVINVGAHVGYFALLAARCVGPSGRVLAIEPAPENFALLKANVEQAGAGHVSLTNAAAWSTPGELELALSRVNTGDHRVFASEEDRERVLVAAVRVDDLLSEQERVDFVLIDTQGAERAVLEGMRRTIERWRPRLQVEFWPVGIRQSGDDPARVASFYRELGYEVAAAITGGRRLTDISGRGDGELIALAEASPGGFCTLILTGNET